MAMCSRSDAVVEPTTSIGDYQRALGFQPPTKPQMNHLEWPEHSWDRPASLLPLPVEVFHLAFLFTFLIAQYLYSGSCGSTPTPQCSS